MGADVGESRGCCEGIFTRGYKRRRGRRRGAWRKGLETSGYAISVLVMPVDLPLKDMTFTEKLHLMEVIWDDLTRDPDKLSSPEWHREVLEERRASAESGKGQFSDWAAAKDDIRQRTS
jgi:hypothetical protein